MTLRFCLVASAFVATTAMAAAEDSPAATRLCKVIDQTKLGAEPCRVDAGRSTVWARMRLEPAEAKGFCEQLSKVIRESTVRFGGENGWRLAIQSPASGEDSVAECDLPR